LESFLPILRKTNTDFSLQVVNPNKLKEIFRNSNGYPEYQWVRDKFSIRVEGNRLYFKYQIVELLSEAEVKVDINNTPHDFFSLFTSLSDGGSSERDFTRVTITSDEVERLQEWGSLNNLNITYEDNILKVRRNEDRT
jgi:hypothetical protein